MVEVLSGIGLFVRVSFPPSSHSFLTIISQVPCQKLGCRFERKCSCSQASSFVIVGRGGREASNRDL